ncbi:MAG: hypothetical protein ACREMZ_12915 [Gemmatimonadales bacterium]
MPRLDPAAVRRLVGALTKRDDDADEPVSEPAPAKLAPTRGFVVRFRSKLTGEVWKFTRKEKVK